MSSKIVICSNCGENIYELVGKPDPSYPVAIAKSFIGINGNEDPTTFNASSCPKCNKDISNEIISVYQRNIC